MNNPQKAVAHAGPVAITALPASGAPPSDDSIFDDTSGLEQSSAVATALLEGEDSVVEGDVASISTIRESLGIFEGDPFADDDAGSLNEVAGGVLSELEDASGPVTTARELGDGPADPDARDQSDGSPGEGELGVVRIRFKKCLKCTHFVPSLTEEDGGVAYNKCHYTKPGQEECPAAEAMVVVSIPVQTIVRNIISYVEAGDSENLAKIFAKLSTKDEMQQQMVFDELRKKGYTFGPQRQKAEA